MGSCSESRIVDGFAHGQKETSGRLSQDDGGILIRMDENIGYGNRGLLELSLSKPARN